MWRTLIYYKPEQIDLAKKLRDDYIAHQKETDVISVEEQDDIEYARENHYDEAIFIEDAETVIIHDIKSLFASDQIRDIFACICNRIIYNRKRID